MRLGEVMDPAIERAKGARREAERGGRTWAAVVAIFTLLLLSPAAVDWLREGATPAELLRAAQAADRDGDLNRAALLTKKAAASGDARAESALGDLYLLGRGTGQDDRRAAAWYRRSAAKEYAPAQRRLGGMLEEGRGVERNDSQALHWYERAAAQGDLRAATRVGILTMLGRGTRRDLGKARDRLIPAAEAGHAEAQLALGRLYASGDGELTPSLPYAIYWLKAAAEQDSAEAQRELARMLLEGDPDAPRAEESVHWYREAAEQGDAPSQYQLSIAYTLGRGVAAIEERALYWLRSAAKQDHERAQLALAERYQEGDGVPRDLSMASQWLGRAKANGSRSAARELRALEGQRDRENRARDLREKRMLASVERGLREDARKRAWLQRQRSKNSPNPVGRCEVGALVQMRSRLDCLSRGGSFRESLGKRSDRGGGTGEVAEDPAVAGARKPSPWRSSEASRDRGSRPTGKTDLSDLYRAAAEGGVARTWWVCHSSRASGSAESQRVCSAPIRSSSGDGEVCKRGNYQGGDRFSNRSEALDWIRSRCWSAERS